MKISTSILTCDFSELKKELESINNTDYIHVDIMDGHFVPNITFGPFISNIVSENTKRLLDVHLMVDEPLKWISKFKFYNTHFITVHPESKDFLDALRKIKMLGIKAGICLKPKTTIESVENYLIDADLILVMTVEPGFGGQAFMESMIEKINKLHELREKHGYKYVIEVDGGVNNESIKLLKDANVDVAVVGSYIFNQKNRRKEIDDLRA